ncbi:methylated-DNA--[protein]-cysteine S-methyltransferase [Kineosporia rhizophila]|nr:methylated-DNA--[protein]-cysteine S-methyltransferase [Kineosporia rhizophila]MCE0539644.1 methylated-DNA--[protein]-cysteine S-methyltransferase [Kineosporia rhizophila]
MTKTAKLWPPFFPGLAERLEQEKVADTMPDSSTPEQAAEISVLEQALTDFLDRGLAEGGEGVADHQSRLRARLAHAAGERGLLDVVYRTIDTELGPLLLAATPVGLVRVAYAVEGHDQVLADLAERIGPRLLHAPERLDQAAQQIGEYLRGDRHSFDLPLDLSLASGFRHTVLAHLQAIAYGSTASYATVAAAAGSPRAVRAVGTACARNPLPVVVPCHRVVRSDGSMGQYVGGVTAKQALLRLEASQAA